MTKEHTQISDSQTTADRLTAELSFNRCRKDHEPVTDSSLTYGDLRLLAKQSSMIGEAARAVEEYSCRTAVPHIATEMSTLAERLRQAALRPDQGEAFKPCITVNEEAGIVEFTAEDVAYIAEPLFPGVYHYIDKHVAMDDRRVVGMATWSATPRVAKSIDLEERLEAAEAEAARLKDENKELGAALKPFAAYIKARDDGDGDIPDDAPAFSYAPDLRGDKVVTVRFADLRRARTLIAAKGG